MKTTYSIVSAVIRPEIGEQITIGLLLIGVEKIYFKFSKDKLNVTKELLPNNTYKFLKETLVNIQKQVEKHNSYADTLLVEEMKSRMFEESYLDYLSIYNNNLLQFSKPRSIESTGDKSLFQMLFNKYIDASLFSFEELKKKEIDYVKSSYLPVLKNFYNIDQQVSHNEFKNLPMSVTIDMIGKNEVVVYAQWIDLQRPNYHILNDIGTILLLNKALEKKDQKFIVTKEPEKKLFPQQHDFWCNLRKNEFAEYVDISEAKRILDYATAHQVRPLFAIQNDIDTNNSAV